MTRGGRPGGSAGGNNGGRGKRGLSGGRARRETSAGGVVFRLTEGEGAPRYLLIRDSYGHWGFPKGHVERGERAETAALREVMEETGLRSLSVAGLVDAIEWRFRFRGAMIDKRCSFFLMEAGPGGTTPQRAEGITACRWAALDDALGLIQYENARSVLRRADTMLRARQAEAVAGRSDAP